MERQGLGIRGWRLGIKGSQSGIRGWGLGIKGTGLGIGSWGFGTLLGLAILIIWSAPAFAAASGSGSDRELAITVRVYDYANLGRGTLIAMERQTAFIFRKVGLTMRWCNMTTDSPHSMVDSSCGLPAASARLDVRIVSRIMAEAGATADSTMGFAMGNSATVSYHWSKAADPKADALSGDILACVIAHEIGHLLLGPDSHSPTGIMKGKWSKEDLQGAGWGRLVFTPKQAELIRAAVRARSGSGERP